MLNPGYIDGTFRWGAEPIVRLYVRAYSGDFAAEQYVYPNNATSTDYHLEPNVPAGTTLDYNLDGHVYLNNRVDPWGNNRWYDLAYYRGPQGVPVSEFATSIADIIVEPGCIEGTITVNGGELYYGYIYAYRNSADGYTYSRHFVDSSGNIRLPVVPNEQINVYGHVISSGVIPGSTYRVRPRYPAHRRMWMSPPARR